MPIKVLMPALSPTMTEGNLVKWLVKEGDAVKSGMVMAEIETDKATMEVEAVDEGVIGKIVIPQGTENVKVNQVIAVILEEGEDASALEGMVFDGAYSPSTPQVQEAITVVPSPVAVEPQSKAPETSGNQRIFVTPLAKRIAQEKGVNLHSIQGSGPHGRIVRDDVEKAAISPKSFSPFQGANIGAASFEDLPLNGMRKVIAKRLTESKQLAPHFYLTVECEIDALLALRKQLNERPSATEKLSVNDFVIRASALALMEVPMANVMWMDSHLRKFNQADVAVAVAVEGGLVTPVIKGANLKSITGLSSEMKSLAQRARDGNLLPEEYQGGSFTISNLGMYGIKTFAAILNYPQSGILAVGAGTERVVAKGGQMQVATLMDCTFSVDHRAIDGAVGAEFLQVFKRLIENPIELLV
jgi:pyruvate dehydrogenase E2 component (dihydrolipoamide acetyltransferase)